MCVLYADELSSDEVDFYARYLLDAANGDVQDTGDEASLDQAVQDGADTVALLTRPTSRQ